MPRLTPLAAVALAAALPLLASAGHAEAASRTSIDQIMREAKVVKPGAYRIGRTSVGCGGARTVISPRFWDYGGAIPGYIIMNPRKLRRVPHYVRLFIYYHECGHQRYGRSETQADCHAIRTGRRQGWLNAKRVRGVCRILFRNSKGDRHHPPGPQRCRQLERCFAGNMVRDRRPSGRGALTVDALNVR